MRAVHLAVAVVAASILAVTLLSASDSGCGVHALRVSASRRHDHSRRASASLSGDDKPAPKAAAPAPAPAAPAAPTPASATGAAGAAVSAAAAAVAAAAAKVASPAASQSQSAASPTSPLAPTAAQVAASVTQTHPNVPTVGIPPTPAALAAAKAAVAAAAAAIVAKVNDGPTAAPVTGKIATADNAVPLLTVRRFGRIKAVSIQEKEYQRHFQNFMRKHRRIYKASDVAKRYQMYKKNWKFVDNFNKKKPETATFKLATNQFMDHSNREFKSKLGFKSARTHAPPSVVAKNAQVVEGLVPNSDFLKKPVAAPKLTPNPRFKQMPASKNWADDPNVVAPIRMQGTCGSCWAFTTASVVESANAILTGTLKPAAPQQLLDCCSTAGGWAPCDGCNGGDFMTAYRFVTQNGLCGWDEYPYTGVGGTCNKACKAQNWITGGAVVAQAGDEAALLAAVNIGPVATAVMAQLPTFQFYASGVYNDLDCPKDFGSLDHAVTLTGYGSDNGQDYWWLRNTWDTTWGEKGYMRLARGVNACGVALESTQPTARLDPNGPESVMMNRVAAEDAANANSNANSTPNSQPPAQPQPQPQPDASQPAEGYGSDESVYWSGAPTQPATAATPAVPAAAAAAAAAAPAAATPAVAPAVPSASPAPLLSSGAPVGGPPVVRGLLGRKPV